jgi:methyl-accepting chemotaxis protein
MRWSRNGRSITRPLSSLTLMVVLSVAIAWVAAPNLDAPTRTVVLVLLFGVGIALGLGVWQAVRASRELKHLALAAESLVNGDASQTARPEALGEFGHLAQSLSRAMDAQRELAGAAQKLAAGEMALKLSPRSDQDTLGQSLLKTKDNMAAMIADAQMLAQAVIEGRLDVRADVTRYEGEFRRAAAAMNGILFTLVGYIDAMPASAMIIDKEFTIRFMNDTGAKIGGKTRQQLVGTKCYDHFRTSDCHTARCASVRAMSSGRAASSKADAHPSGLHLGITSMSVPIRDNDGDVIGAFEVAADRTTITHAEEMGGLVPSFRFSDVHATPARSPRRPVTVRSGNGHNGNGAKPGNGAGHHGRNGNGGSSTPFETKEELVLQEF